MKLHHYSDEEIIHVLTVPDEFSFTRDELETIARIASYSGAGFIIFEADKECGSEDLKYGSVSAYLRIKSVPDGRSTKSFVGDVSLFLGGVISGFKRDIIGPMGSF
jgi:hypothetical protein